MSSQLDNLEKLARLRDSGVLSDEEFAQQKALILATPSQSPTLDSVRRINVDRSGAPRGDDAERVAAGEAALDQDFFFDPLRTISSPVAAGALIKVAPGAAVMVFLDEVIQLGTDFYWSGTEALSPEMPNEAVLSINLAGLIIWVGLASLFAWVTLTRRSRWSAIALLLMTALGAMVHIQSFLATRQFQLAYLAGGLAVLFAVQALRGVYAYRRLSKAESYEA